MRTAVLSYLGLLISLAVARFFPQLSFIPYLYMSFPIIFLSDSRLGFGNYKKGLLWGSVFLPGLILFPPDLIGWKVVASQAGIAFIEEIFFRAYLMRELGNFWTSLLFSGAHMINFPGVNSVLVFFPSLIFGYAYLRSGSIVAPWLLHWTSNLIYLSFQKKFPELYHFFN